MKKRKKLQKIKGLLIDPENQTIEEVEFLPTLKSYYRLLECDCITSVMYDNSHDLILDDEALFKYPSIGFRKEGEDLNHSYFGKAMIVGHNKETWKEVSHQLDIYEVKDTIEFFSVYKSKRVTVVINEGKAK